MAVPNVKNVEKFQSNVSAGNKNLTVSEVRISPRHSGLLIFSPGTKIVGGAPFPAIFRFRREQLQPDGVNFS